MSSRTRNRKVGLTKPVGPTLKIGMVATSDYRPKLEPLDQKACALWAADCTEHVLPNFEKIRPGDDRPRKAIAAARAWARGQITMMMARATAVQAHAAARDSRHPAATAAARAAGHAAATAHSIRHALGAPAYAIVSVAATAAHDRQNRVIEVERAWQLGRLRKARMIFLVRRSSPLG